jgi:hypothetical protein
VNAFAKGEGFCSLNVRAWWKVYSVLHLHSDYANQHHSTHGLSFLMPAAKDKAHTEIGRKISRENRTGIYVFFQNSNGKIKDQQGFHSFLNFETIPALRKT